MAEAKAIDKKEKAIDLKQIIALVSMCWAWIWTVISVASALTLAGSAIAKTSSTTASAICPLFHAAATMAQGVTNLSLAEKEKDVAFIRAAAVQLRAFFWKQDEANSKYAGGL
jgi:hypothetical protein